MRRSPRQKKSSKVIFPKWLRETETFKKGSGISMTSETNAIIELVSNAHLILMDGKPKITVKKNGCYVLYLQNGTKCIFEKFLDVPTVDIDGIEVPFESILEYEDPSMAPPPSQSKK
jgi:hypothetical protein